MSAIVEAEDDGAIIAAAPFGLITSANTLRVVDYAFPIFQLISIRTVVWAVFDGAVKPCIAFVTNASPIYLANSVFTAIIASLRRDRVDINKAERVVAVRFRTIITVIA